MAVLGWCAASASADPGSARAVERSTRATGQVAADASGHANTGTLGAARRSRRRRSRMDPGPRRRRRPELQRLVVRLDRQHRSARAPTARGRRVGAALGLARAAGATCSPTARSSATAAPTASTPAWSGGMAFYVSSAAEYTISPEVPAAIGLGRRLAPRHRLLRRRPRAAVDRRLAGRRGNAHDRGRSSYTHGSPACTSAPIAARATSASAARSTTSRCGTTARRWRRPAPSIQPVRRHADAHRARRAAPAARRPVPPRASPTAACG